METKDILEEAILTGELLTIVYQGGSQPGSYRKISPMNIEGDKVRAHCYTSNRIKLFSIDKITIAKNLKGKASYVDNKNVKEPENLSAAIQPFIKELTSLGWHVKFDNETAGLYRFFKNGKMRETPDIYLLYEEFDNSYIDFGKYGSEVNKKEMRSRPWYVRSNVAKENARTFKSLRHAMEQFVIYAREGAIHLGLQS